MMFVVYKIARSIIRRLRNIINTFFYQLVMKKMGKGSKVFYGFYSPGVDNIEIGNNCIIDTNVSFVSEFKESKLILGNNVKINKGVTLDYSGGLIIEDNVVISAESYIFTHSHGYNPNSIPVPKPLIIKSNTWLGARVIIGENVSVIGRGALIASGSVVTKDVKDNTIVGGNPAKFLKEKK